MNIRELFKRIEDCDDLLEDLKGELNLEGNCIVWSFNLSDSDLEFQHHDNEDDDFNYDIISPTEMLQEVYEEDFRVIENIINEVDEYNDWDFSQPEVGDTIISFRIY